MELFHAANQWATRPDDERFNSLEEMHRATKGYAATAGEAVVPWGDIRVQTAGDDIVTVGKTGNAARLTHHSFGQLSARAGAPAGYLRGLPGELAVQNINHGLKERGSVENDATDAQLLFHTNGNLLLRAATSTRYERVWNHEVLARMIPFADRHGLVPAQATFDWADRSANADPGPCLHCIDWGYNPPHCDVCNGTRKAPTVLDPNADKALYASDHDMFAFIMTPDRTIVGPVGDTLRRGVIVINSEVGSASLKFMGFLFRDVCANHIIWGAEGLTEVSLRHVGDIHGKWNESMAVVRKYMDGAASIDEAKFAELRVKIGDTKEEVLDNLFGIRKLQASRKLLDAAYEAVVPDEDGDPNTVWGMVQGITRHSQTLTHADGRQDVDRIAGRLLQVAF